MTSDPRAFFRPGLLPVLLAAAVLSGGQQAGAVDFNRDIRPILSNKCFACHGFDEHERKADLRLDTREGAFADLGGYQAVVAGKPEESEAWLRIALPNDDEEVMPPEKFHKALTAEEKALIKAWIEEGAEYDIHWSYRPLQRPEGEGIDDFVAEGLKEAGLDFSPEADPATLVRRLHLDLTGLPPDVETVRAFVADHSPEAYERLVDRLLESPAYGERMAVFWLDLVRYADTIGYHSDNFMEVSAYRDYVIEAFNRNLPFDRFTTEQLAGDLLPGATLEQRIASGYNRLLQTTEEGGAQAEEYKVIHAADRVRNFSAVWMGSTVGCAQCHDHKYDPFTMRDHYAMAAFFADIKERPNGRRQPNLKLPTEAEEAAMAELKLKLAEQTPEKRLEADSKLAERFAAAQAAWESEVLAQLENRSSDWTVVEPSDLKSSGGQTLKKQDDLSVLASGKNPAKDTYTVTVKAKGPVRALRLEALTDDSLVNKSLSRANGNFVLSEVLVKHGNQPIEIAAAKADFEQGGWPVAHVLDGKPGTGWAVDGHNKAEDHVALFQFAEPVELGEGGNLVVELKHQSAHAKHNIGRFRLSVSASENPTLAGGVDLPPAVIEALEVSAAERSKKQIKQLRDHYLGLAPMFAEARAEVEAWRKELEANEKGQRTMLVSEALETPRMTRVLDRGSWLDKDGEVVEPALPAFLPKDSDKVAPSGARLTRLDLAKWVMAESNPLTSRAFVNRAWALTFGRGISPDLIDWLAVEFRDGGWDIKKLMKALVMSRTYRQTSTVATVQAEKDPGNERWGRQGRWRLEAEFVRDGSLELAGLLERQLLGGRSVKPYQPAGYWQHLNFPKRKWEAGSGEDLYRRGVYTFWCRSFPHPAMVAFDAPSREECTAERSRSNIPQQALVLLNDPVFVEAARHFGERIAEAPAKDGSVEARLGWGWEAATSRQPSGDELGVLRQLYAQQLARFTEDEEAAKALLAVGESPASETLPPAEAAAWAMVARTILNTYEASSRP